MISALASLGAVPAVAAGWRPIALGLVALFPIDFEKAGAHVARMQLHNAVAGAFKFPRHADSIIGSAFSAGGLFLFAFRLANHHVTAVAPAPFEIAAGRGIFYDRSDDFDEICVRRQQRVLETELFDIGVDIASADPKDRLKIGNHRFEPFCHKANLT